MFSNNVFTCTGIKGERQTGMTRIELELYKLMDYNALLFNKSALINRCIHQLKICNNLYVHLGFFHMCDQVLGKEWAHWATDPISYIYEQEYTYMCTLLYNGIYIYTDKIIYTS